MATPFLPDKTTTRALVLLGATAAQNLLGKDFRLTKHRAPCRAPTTATNCSPDWCQTSA